MKTKDFILIGLAGVVIAQFMWPKPVESPYYLREMKQSKERMDSLVTLTNTLQPLRYEIKDSMDTVNAVYVDISKEQLRARVRHNLLSNRNR